MAQAERKPPLARPGPDTGEPTLRLTLPPEPDELPRAGRAHRALWLVLPIVALAELVGHGVIVARVPAEDDWTRAAAFVREELEPTDRIVSAPYWTDPLLRLHLGDVMPMAMAAPGDNAVYERLFELAIRGHRSSAAPDRDPDAVARFGRVTVNRWDLGPTIVKYDFVAQLHSAVVEKVTNGRSERCDWRRQTATGRSGLGQGSMTPGERFDCGRHPLWVGATVVESLDYSPRFCIQQHPQGRDPIRATFRGVPLGDRLVLHAGLYNRHEREGGHAPIKARVLVDGAVIGQMVHRDLEGWKSVVLATRPPEEAAEAPDAVGDVTIEVTADNPRFRTFCWTATTRAGEREGDL